MKQIWISLLSVIMVICSPLASLEIEGQNLKDLVARDEGLKRILNMHRILESFEQHDLFFDSFEKKIYLLTNNLGQCYDVYAYMQILNVMKKEIILMNERESYGIWLYNKAINQLIADVDNSIYTCDDKKNIYKCAEIMKCKIQEINMIISSNLELLDITNAYEREAQNLMRH